MNPPFVLSKPPGEDLLQVARAIYRVAAETNVPFLLTGAAARDIVLVNLWGMSPGRATVDIDFGFAISSWAEFERLRDGLVNTGRFRRVPHQTQRLIYEDPENAFEIPVDFVPFGGVASEHQTIAWPPEGDFVMNVVGFDEALTSALPIELESGLILAVASLPGLVILKLIAWCDRHAENNKDAVDFWTVLSSYAQAGNEDRIYEHEIDLLEKLGYDLTLAGASLLGRDARRVSGGGAARHIESLLATEAQADLLVSQMLAATYEENAPEVERLFEAFRKAFLNG